MLKSNATNTNVSVLFYLGRRIEPSKQTITPTRMFYQKYIGRCIYVRLVPENSRLTIQCLFYLILLQDTVS